MRKSFILLFGIILLFPLLLSTITVTVESSRRVPVIIMFKDKCDVSIVKSVGGHVKISYKFKPAVAAVIPEQAIEALKRNPKVSYVVMDIPIKPVGQVVPWGVERIGALTVHSSGNMGDGVNVAILDTGIDKEHPDLSYVWGYDFTGDNDPDPQDYDGWNRIGWRANVPELYGWIYGRWRGRWTGEPITWDGVPIIYRMWENRWEGRGKGAEEGRYISQSVKGI